jgi:hypothetical protein
MRSKLLYKNCHLKWPANAVGRVNSRRKTAVAGGVDNLAKGLWPWSQGPPGKGGKESARRNEAGPFVAELKIFKIMHLMRNLLILIGGTGVLLALVDLLVSAQV